MDYSLRLPGRPPVVLRGWGNLPIELLAAAAGVKAATHCWLDERDLPYLAETADALGLRHLVYARGGAGQTPDRLGVMVGAKLEDLEACALAWETPQSNPGPELGYPPCCSSFYVDWINATLGDNPERVDVIRLIHRNTPSPAGLPFLLNDVFYMYSRRWAQGDADKREQICRKNAGLDLNNMNVIPWHPCSYRCPAALEKAQAIWALISAHIPALAATLRACLARPVLFWDWDRFAVLRAEPAGAGRWSLKGVMPPYSLLEPAAAARLAEADGLEWTPGSAPALYKGRRKLKPLEGDPIMLDFVPPK